MSEAAVELAELLTELRATEGKLGRAKLLVNGGKILKELSTEERVRVAYTLGVDNIGELLLKMDRDEITDEDIEALVSRAEQLDPVEVGSLIADLDDPAIRQQRLKDLVDVAVPATAAAAAADVATDDEHLPGPAPDEPIDVAPPPELVDPPEPMTAPESSAAPAPEPEAPPPPPPPPPAQPPPPPPSLHHPQTAAPVPAPAPAADSSALATAIAALTSPVAQLRTVRMRTDEANDLTLPQLLALVRTFPEGWRRRRAVSLLVDAGVPARFGDALTVIGCLTNPSDWVWAASGLVRGREMAASELADLLAAAPTDQARQRIAMRAS